MLADVLSQVIHTGIYQSLSIVKNWNFEWILQFVASKMYYLLIIWVLTTNKLTNTQQILVTRISFCPLCLCPWKIFWYVSIIKKLFVMSRSDHIRWSFFMPNMPWTLTNRKQISFMQPECLVHFSSKTFCALNKWSIYFFLIFWTYLHIGHLNQSNKINTDGHDLPWTQ